MLLSNEWRLYADEWNGLNLTIDVVLLPYQFKVSTEAR
jgi:hypothetical protein